MCPTFATLSPAAILFRIPCRHAQRLYHVLGRHSSIACFEFGCTTKKLQAFSYRPTCQANKACRACFSASPGLSIVDSTKSHQEDTVGILHNAVSSDLLLQPDDPGVAVSMRIRIKPAHRKIHRPLHDSDAPTARSGLDDAIKPILPTYIEVFSHDMHPGPKI